ncbi:MAG: carboxylating nicotinate-nucleotide diphosphorylase [Candidatus Omnitrophota bacterium]
MNRTINFALKEDIGRGDITTNTLIPRKAVSQAYVITNEKAVVCGLDVVQKLFRKLDRKATFRCFFKEGEIAPKNSKLIYIKAKTRAVLTGERVALNFLSHLMAVATKTRLFVQQVKPYQAKIYDTRKTTPGLRVLEKKAVRAGGGINHRLNLNEMILIKDNHRAKVQCSTSSSLQDMVRYAKKVSRKPIEIELDNLMHFQEVLASQPDIILLDNMSIAQIKKAVALKKKYVKNKRIKLEVSGNVNLKNVRAIARTGVDRISSGALTHTKKAIDISLELIS